MGGQLRQAALLARTIKAGVSRSDGKRRAPRRSRRGLILLLGGFIAGVLVVALLLAPQSPVSVRKKK